MSNLGGDFRHSLKTLQFSYKIAYTLCVDWCLMPISFSISPCYKFLTINSVEKNVGTILRPQARTM